MYERKVIRQNKLSGIVRKTKSGRFAIDEQMFDTENDLLSYFGIPVKSRRSKKRHVTSRAY